MHVRAPEGHGAWGKRTKGGRSWKRAAINRIAILRIGLGSGGVNLGTGAESERFHDHKDHDERSSHAGYLVK